MNILIIFIDIILAIMFTYFGIKSKDANEVKGALAIAFILILNAIF